MNETSNPKISVAIAIYNEESVLPELYRRTSAVLADMPGGPHEITLVDDGSSDGSLEWLEALARIDPHVKVVSLSRNFGHQAALSAALDHVSGDVTIVMDGDLQDAPELIPQFVERYRQGFDVVYAVRRTRKENWLKRACYAGFYRLIRSLAEVDLPAGSGDFALLSRRVVDFMRTSQERNRYLRGLRTWVGFRQTDLPVDRDARHSGKPKYNIRKLLKLAFDGIFSFSTAPLRAATLLGAGTICVSLLYAFYALFARIAWQQSPQGFTALILAITFLSGVQLLFLGVIGEYVGRTYEEVKRRPHYIVDRVLTADSFASSPTWLTDSARAIEVLDERLATERKVAGLEAKSETAATPAS
jgi:dolichol-phosphate mannosyltransferase